MLFENCTSVQVVRADDRWEFTEDHKVNGSTNSTDEHGGGGGGPRITSTVV